MLFHQLLWKLDTPSDMILLLLKFISEMACFTVGFFLHYIPPIIAQGLSQRSSFTVGFFLHYTSYHCSSLSQRSCFTVGFFLHYTSHYSSSLSQRLLLYSGILPSLYLLSLLQFISEILLYSGILPSLYLLLFLKFISEIPPLQWDSSFAIPPIIAQVYLRDPALHSTIPCINISTPSFLIPIWPQQSSCRSVQGQSSMYIQLV